MGSVPWGLGTVYDRTRKGETRAPFKGLEKEGRRCSGADATRKAQRVGSLAGVETDKRWRLYATLAMA